MSWYRQVKTIYTVSYLMFIFICSSLLNAFIIKKELPFEAYIIFLVSIFIMQFLVCKDKKKSITIAAPSAFVLIVNYLIYPSEQAILNSILNVIVIMFLQKLEGEDALYDTYKGRMKKAILVLIVIGALIPSLKGINLGLTLRFYVLFLGAVVITLRAARNYSNKISSKRSIFTNFCFLAGGIMVSSEYGFYAIKTSIKWILVPIDFILVKLSTFILEIVYRPFLFLIKIIIDIFNFLMRLLPHNVQKPAIENVDNASKIFPKDGSTTTPAIIFIILAILLIFILYKFYKKLAARNERRKSVTPHDLQRERIIRGTKKKGRLFPNLFNKIFKADGSMRNQILATYRKFQVTMNLRGVFRTYMTATQLSNVAKTKIDEREALDSIKSIYNEAKFSSHEISKENVEAIKEQYEKVKKTPYNE